jgi:hypothetical protein
MHDALINSLNEVASYRGTSHNAKHLMQSAAVELANSVSREKYGEAINAVGEKAIALLTTVPASQYQEAVDFKEQYHEEWMLAARENEKLREILGISRLADIETGDTVTIRVSIDGGKSWDYRVVSPSPTITGLEIKQNSPNANNQDA